MVIIEVLIPYYVPEFWPFTFIVLLNFPRTWLSIVIPAQN